MKKRVLLIEDSSGFQDLISRKFAALVPEWELVVVGTMDAGRKACLAGFDLIILDLALPDSPSEMTIGLIPALRMTAPVDVLTGRDCRESNCFTECFEKGADDVWEKTSLCDQGWLFFIHACNATIARNEARTNE